MRGFYRVKAEVFKERRDPDKALTPSGFGCIVLHQTKAFRILHSATNPNAALEDAGGILLAGDWPALKVALPKAQRDRVFHRRVKRTVEVDDENVVQTLSVPRGLSVVGDVVEDDWLPPHKFLGDPEPEPVL